MSSILINQMQFVALLSLVDTDSLSQDTLLGGFAVSLRYAIVHVSLKVSMRVNTHVRLHDYVSSCVYV